MQGLVLGDAKVLQLLLFTKKIMDKVFVFSLNCIIFASKYLKQ